MPVRSQFDPRYKLIVSPLTFGDLQLEIYTEGKRVSCTIVLILENRDYVVISRHLTPYFMPMAVEWLVNKYPYKSIKTI